MNPTMRFLIVFACLVVAALEAPRAAAVLTEDVAGPYAACGSAPLASVPRGVSAESALLAADRAPVSRFDSFGPTPETPHDPSEHDAPRHAGSR